MLRMLANVRERRKVMNQEARRELCKLKACLIFTNVWFVYLTLGTEAHTHTYIEEHGPGQLSTHRVDGSARLAREWALRQVIAVKLH